MDKSRPPDVSVDTRTASHAQLDYIWTEESDSPFTKIVFNRFSLPLVAHRRSCIVMNVSHFFFYLYHTLEWNFVYVNSVYLNQNFNPIKSNFSTVSNKLLLVEYAPYKDFIKSLVQRTSNRFLSYELQLYKLFVLRIFKFILTEFYYI